MIAQNFKEIQPLLGFLPSLLPLPPSPQSNTNKIKGAREI